MPIEIDPKNSSRAMAFELWMKAPNPMVTFFKTLDVTDLLTVSKQKKLKFNMFLCYCITKAAVGIEEFYTLPGNGKLFQYDKLAINVIVNNKDGGINSCDIPFSDDIRQFNRNYLELTAQVARECKSSFLEDHIIVGTSAMVQTELDCIVNQYTDKFSNPMVMWGKYRKGLFKTTLPVSFQFHHVQMDGGHAARFLQRLQNEINKL